MIAGAIFMGTSRTRYVHTCSTFPGLGPSGPAFSTCSTTTSKSILTKGPSFSPSARKTVRTLPWTTTVAVSSFSDSAARADAVSSQTRAKHPYVTERMENPPKAERSRAAAAAASPPPLARMYDTAHQPGPEAGATLYCTTERTTHQGPDPGLVQVEAVLFDARVDFTDRFFYPFTSPCSLISRLLQGGAQSGQCGACL